MAGYRLKDQQTFKAALENGSEDEIRLVLSKLVKHLDDRLLITDKWQFDGHGVSQLTVFQARDENRTMLYLLADAKGKIHLGLCHELKKHETLEMEDFDTSWHQVTSIFVSNKTHPVGDLQDVWVLVRRRPEDEPNLVLYHGWAGYDGKELALGPARDHVAKKRGEGWQPGMKTENLPSWMREYKTTLDFAHDPFSGDTLQPENIGPMDCCHRTPSYFISSRDDAIRFHGKTSFIVESREWLNAFAVSEIQGRLNFSLTLGCDDRYLVGYPIVEGKQKDHLFYDPCEDTPAALAHLPMAATDEWPDMLVSFYNGKLRRIRYHDRDKTRELWDALWSKLGMFDYKKFTAAREANLAWNGSETDDMDPDTVTADWHEALLTRAIDGLLRFPSKRQSKLPSDKKMREALLDQWAKELGPWMARGPHEQELQIKAADQLVRALGDLLRDFCVSEGERLKLDLNGPVKTELKALRLDFLLATLEHFYFHLAGIKAQGRIDRFFRSNKLLIPGKTGHEALEKMLNQAFISRDDFWHANWDDTKRSQWRERGKLAMDRWASAYWPADIVRLRSARLRPLVSLCGLEWEGHKAIVLASLKGAYLYPIEAQPRDVDWEAQPRDFDRIYANFPRLDKRRDPKTINLENGATIRCLVPLKQGPGRFLLADDRDVLYLYQASKAEKWQVSKLNTFQLKQQGLIQDMSVCRDGSGCYHIAVVTMKEHTSYLSILKLDGEEIHQVGATRPLKSPKANLIDLVRRDGSYVLGKGSQHMARSAIQHIDDQGKVGETRWLAGLRGATAALAFDRTKKPEYFLVADKGNMVWCYRLDYADVVDHWWVYKARGVVRSIVSVIHSGEPHFLTGSEEGELTLLRARDGCRVWKEHLKQPIRQLFDPFGDQKQIAILMNGGWLAFYSHLDLNSHDALEDARRCMRQAMLERQTFEGELEDADAQALAMLYRLEEKREGPGAQINYTTKETHARLLRYLLQTQDCPTLERAFTGLLPKLSCGDIYRLVNYLAERPDSDLMRLIWRDLQKRPYSKARGAARSAWLQVWERTDPTIKALDDLHLENEDLKNPWLGLVFARALLRAVARDAGLGSEDGQALIEKLLPVLFKFPASLFIYCLECLGEDKAAYQTLKPAADVFERLARGRKPRAEDLQHLADHSETAPDHSVLCLIQCLARLMADYIENQACEVPWQDWRYQAHDLFRDLQQRCSRRMDDRARPLKKLLRTVLPASIMPRDQEPLKDYLPWWEDIQRNVTEEREVERDQTDDWPYLVEYFGKLSVDILREMARLELAYLSRETRPMLRLRETFLTENGQWQLSFSCRPEGRRPVRDATLNFEISNSQGLALPGIERYSHGFDLYPNAFPEFDFQLSGFPRPGQREVVVRAKIVGRGYERETRWSFPLSSDLRHHFHAYTLADHLPDSLAAIVPAIPLENQRLNLAVIDGPRSQRALAAQLVTRQRGFAVDLDDLFAETGENRIYDQAKTDAANIWKMIEDHVEERLRSRGVAAGGIWLILGPTVDFTERFILSGANTNLTSLIRRMTAFLMGETYQGIIWCLESRHVRPFRALLEPPLNIWSSHGYLRGRLQRPGNSEEKQEVDKLISEMVGDEAPFKKEELLGVLNSDVRLVLHWCQWYRRHKEMHIAGLFQKGAVIDLLRADLAALTPLELLLTMYWSVAETRVPVSQLREGMIPQEEVDSTVTKKTNRPKRIIHGGDALMTGNLRALKSDHANKAFLTVAGHGRGTLVDSHTSLRSLVLSFGPEERVQAGARLVKQGIASNIGDLFRTLSPYDRVIRNLYDRNEHEKQIDTSVYRAIKGRFSLPLESIDFDKISQIPDRLLEALMPTASKEERFSIRRLAQLWLKDEQVHEAHGVLETTFKGKLLYIGKQPPKGLAGELADAYFALNKDRTVLVHGTWGQPLSFWFWYPAEQRPEISKCVKRVEDFLTEKRRIEARRAKNQGKNDETPMATSCQIILLGPGVRGMALDPDHRAAIIEPVHLLQAAWQGSFFESLLRLAREQLRLSALSPFKSSGPLPPGSPLFKGREKELDYIKQQVRQKSILIVGSRRVGKTSLLNQVAHWARQQMDLCPIFVDLQGCANREQFMEAFQSARHGPANTHLAEFEALDHATSITSLIEMLHSRGETPLFLLNEIDHLALHDIQFVESWRSFHEQDRARFVMVGYSVLARLGRINEPFFHWTSGLHFDGKAIVLGRLSRAAATSLLDLLEEHPLELRWMHEQKALSHELLLQRSYRIPWVLQEYCRLCVERMEEKRDHRLSYALIEDVLSGQGDVVWRYIESINFADLGYHGPGSVEKDGFFMILYCLVRDRYFRDKRWLQDERLDDISPTNEKLGFTVSQAESVILDTMEELLVESEVRRLKKWLEGVELNQVFRLLTLTLLLEPDPIEEKRYGFMMHILPRELERRIKTKNTYLDDLVINLAIKMVNKLKEKDNG